MAVGRISGPLLNKNLLRNGVDLAFETNLLYLSVSNADPANWRIGVKTTAPVYDLDVNGTTRSTNFLATTATINEVYISSSNIASNFGDLTLTANSGNRVVIGTVGQNNDLLVNGNFHATGNITLDGNITLGNNPSDTVTFDAEINSHLIPDLTNTWDLGSSTLKWRNLYLSGNIASGVIDGGNIRLSGNTISSLDTNGNINLSPNGTGYVQVNGTNGLVIPSGTSLQQAPNVIGAVRFNTDSNSFEGYNGGQWTSLGGVRSVDGKAYIIAETSPGAGDDTLHFYAVDGTNTSQNIGNWNGTALTILSPGLTVPVGNDANRPTGVTGYIRFNTDSLSFEGYQGSQWSSLGGVKSVDGKAYIIAETSPGAGDDVLHFYSGSSGTSSQVGTWDNTALTVLSPGLLVPTGDTNSRPTGVNGYIRYNTDQGQFEGYASNNWSSLGGVKSVDGATYIIPEAYPGAGDNTLYFYANNTLEATITTTGLNVVNDITTDTLHVTGTSTLADVDATSLLVNGKISIHDNIIENTQDGDDLIIRAKGLGRVILDGSGSSAGDGNVLATDPLLVLNTGVVGTNSYDSGLILNRGTDQNVALVWSESSQEFRAIGTLEQGTVRGTVAVASYQNVATASVKLNSETANKVTFTDDNKIVRSLDSGRTAYVDGAMVFNSTADLALPAGTIDQRPANPHTGSIRFNTTYQQFEGYANSAWSSIVGSPGGSPVDYQSLVGDGINYQFTLDQTPLNANSIMVTINGVLQEPNYSYQVTGNILDFTGSDSVSYPPELGDRIDVRFLSKASVSSIKEYNYVGDGVTTTFNTELTINSVAEVLVFVNNIYQDSAVYTVSGNSVIFSQAPFNTERVCLVHLCSVFVSNIASPDDAIIYSLALG